MGGGGGGKEGGCVEMGYGAVELGFRRNKVHVDSRYAKF